MPTEIMSLEQRSRALLAHVADGTASYQEAAESMLVGAALAVLGHRLLPPGSTEAQVANAAMEAAANDLLSMADRFRGNKLTSKVIFLDIDGVILPLGAEQFDLAAIERINALVHKAGAEIVVVSSWRRHIGPVETIDALVAAGLAKPLCCLPGSSEFSTKAEDVAAWLHGRTDIQAWVLIDDDPAVCRAVRKLKDSRGLAIEIGAGNFGQGAFNRAQRHLSIKERPVCYGTDDCSSDFLVSCPWAQSCGGET